MKRPLKEELQDVWLSVNQVQQLNYFGYTVDGEETIVSSDLDHIRDFAASDLEDFAQLVDYNQDDGLITIDDNSYAYRGQSQSDQRFLVLVLDTSVVHRRSDLFSTSIELSLYSLLLFVLIVFVFAGQDPIKPYVENAGIRFIANAGHELKTPLAIISANTEMQELLEGNRVKQVNQGPGASDDRLDQSHGDPG